MPLNVHGIHSSVKAESAGVDETQQSTQGTKLENKDKAGRYNNIQSHMLGMPIVRQPVYIQALPSK